MEMVIYVSIIVLIEELLEFGVIYWLCVKVFNVWKDIFGNEEMIVVVFLGIICGVYVCIDVL